MLVTIWDSKATAVIDSVGAQLISYKDADQKEYIWQRDPKFWEKSSPILFPIVGNLRNDETIIEGKPYHLTKHQLVIFKSRAILHRTVKTGMSADAVVNGPVIPVVYLIMYGENSVLQLIFQGKTERVRIDSLSLL